MIESERLDYRHRIVSRNWHIRELYRVIRLIKMASEQGDLDTVRALSEMTEEQPAAEPGDLNPEEYAQAFEY